MWRRGLQLLVKTNQGLGQLKAELGRSFIPVDVDSFPWFSAFCSWKRNDVVNSAHGTECRNAKVLVITGDQRE